MDEHQLSVLMQSLTSAITSVFGESSIVNVKKRNKKLKEGDFVVSVSGDQCGRDLQWTHQTKVRLSKDREVMCVSSNFTNDKLFVSLERKTMMQILISEVTTKGQQYGQHCVKPKSIVLLANPLLLHEHTEDLSLESMRSILTSFYVSQLLGANSCMVCCPVLNKKLLADLNVLWEPLLEELKDLSASDIFQSEELAILKQEFLQTLSSSEYVLPTDVSHVSTNKIKIDGEKFILNIGHGEKFSKNIKVVNYHKDSVAVSDVVSLELCKRRNYSAGVRVICVHVVPKSMEYQHQLVELG